jgi:hypothetical protein
MARVLVRAGSCLLRAHVLCCVWRWGYARVAASRVFWQEARLRLGRGQGLVV